MEEAIEEARRVVARGRVFLQGRWHKRTRTNQTVIAATEMPDLVPLARLTSCYTTGRDTAVVRRL